MAKTPAPPQGPYGSCLDLPTVADMLQTIRGAKVLTLFVARLEHTKLKDVEKQLRHMCEVVDRFYDILGDRHWQFHDYLSIPDVEALLSEATAEEAEQRLIAIYQDSKTLSSLVRRLNGLPAMRLRLGLIEKAQADYEAERFYASTLVLLTVMDGFVNDFETQRRGLHARQAEEMNAWDSVVGHHKGLSHAHRSFTKSTGKTTSDEIFELQRNGIVHGTILNYDNVVVATKAWNRLFAVADWAKSLEKQKHYAVNEPTLSETLATFRELEQQKAVLAQWQPHSLTPGTPEFEKSDAFTATNNYLEAWQQMQYGSMAAYISRSFLSATARQMAGRVREECSPFSLDGFEILKLDFPAAAVCEASATLTLDGTAKAAKMRWIREHEDGQPAIPGDGGEWKLYVWGPLGMINMASRAAK